MSSRERLLVTLRGEIPDRVPVAPFIQDEYLAYYYPEKPIVDRVVTACELADELGFDLIAKHRQFEFPHFFKRSYPNWELRKSVAHSGEMIIERMEIETPRGTLVQEDVGPDVGVASAGIYKTTRRHLLDTPEAVEIFFDYVPPLDDESRRQMHEIARQWRAVVGERGILAPWGWGGVFNMAALLRGMEGLYVEPYINETYYRDFMQRLLDVALPYNQALAETEIECIGLQGHMANGSVVGEDFYRTYVQPYEKPLIDGIHAAGAFTVFHNCGCARVLYPNYRELSMTVWETVSSSPQGDNDLAEAKALLGDRVCLLGNLDQVHFLKEATPQEVAEAARRIVAVGKPGGRYIFAASDFLETGTPRENVVAMIEAAKEAGIYD